MSDDMTLRITATNTSPSDRNTGVVSSKPRKSAGSKREACKSGVSVTLGTDHLLSILSAPLLPPSRRPPFGTPGVNGREGERRGAGSAPAGSPTCQTFPKPGPPRPRPSAAPRPPSLAGGGTAGPGGGEGRPRGPGVVGGDRGTRGVVRGDRGARGVAGGAELGRRGSRREKGCPEPGFLPRLGVRRVSASRGARGAARRGRAHPPAPRSCGCRAGRAAGEEGPPPSAATPPPPPGGSRRHPPPPTPLPRNALFTAAAPGAHARCPARG
nr:collagen alpha-1(I) chain-like [Manis javanica]